jgi:type IV pilus assembly protein PilA
LNKEERAVKIFRRKKKGFTLIELMIVIAIIAVLAAILIVQWVGARQAAYDSEALTVARNCVLAAQVYYAQNKLSYLNLDKTDLANIEPSLGTTPVSITVNSATANGFEIRVDGQGSTPKTYWATEAGVTDVDPSP